MAAIYGEEPTTVHRGRGTQHQITVMDIRSAVELYQVDFVAHHDDARPYIDATRTMAV